jgi:uncharacterized membrane protein
MTKLDKETMQPILIVVTLALIVWQMFSLNYFNIENSDGVVGYTMGLYLTDRTPGLKKDSPSGEVLKNELACMGMQGLDQLNYCNGLFVMEKLHVVLVVLLLLSIVPKCRANLALLLPIMLLLTTIFVFALFSVKRDEILTLERGSENGSDVMSRYGESFWINVVLMLVSLGMLYLYKMKK